jgi:hypothetical protein
MGVLIEEERSSKDQLIDQLNSFGCQLTRLCSALPSAYMKLAIRRSRQARHDEHRSDHSSRQYVPYLLPYCCLSDLL